MGVFGKGLYSRSGPVVLLEDEEPESKRDPDIEHYMHPQHAMQMNPFGASVSGLPLALHLTKDSPSMEEILRMQGEDDDEDLDRDDENDDTNEKVNPDDEDSDTELVSNDASVLSFLTNSESSPNMLPFLPISSRNEHLILSIYEAFYLQFALGMLRLHEVSISEYFAFCQQRDEKFLIRYATYHYFRSKGWVPRTGMNFGCDFVVYRFGPGIDHGQFCVQCYDASTHGSVLNWRDVQHQSRMSISVKKKLLFCRVEGLQQDGLCADPHECFANAKVNTMAFSRVVL